MESGETVGGGLARHEACLRLQLELTRDCLVEEADEYVAEALRVVVVGTVTAVSDLENLGLALAVELVGLDDLVGAFRAHEVSVAEAEADREGCAVQEPVRLAQSVVGLESVLVGLSIDGFERSDLAEAQVLISCCSLMNLVRVALVLRLCELEEE